MMNPLMNEFIDLHDAYFILKNGVVIGSYNETNVLPAFQSGKFKLIHIIDQDCNFDIEFLENSQVHISEVVLFHEAKTLKKTIKVHKNANIDYLSYVSTNEGISAKITTNANVFSQATLSNNMLFICKDFCNCSQQVHLLGEKANYKTKNVMINSFGKTQDFSYKVTHHVAFTESSLQNYGISHHQSLLNIFTDGIIEKNAVKAILKQKAKGLILDETSKISANPWLEINEHDCLASHGASIGAIDDQELYYLMSRGLTKEESEKLIINGFIWPLIREVPAGKLKSYLIMQTNSHL